MLLALALRLLLWSQPLHQLANDEVEYVAVARDLLAGRGWQFYEHYHWLRAPLYPLFLAGSLWLAGGDPATSQALHRAALPNIVLSVATVYLSYRLALALFGRRSGASGRAPLVAALLTAILWTLATFASLYMSETLFTFLFTAGLLCLVRRPTTNEPRATSDERRAASDERRATIGEKCSVAAAGILFGLATLTRSITLLFLPIVAIWLLLYRRRTRDDGRWPRIRRARIRRARIRRARIRRARIRRPQRARPTDVIGWWSVVGGRWSVVVCFVLCAVLVIVPWTIRNYNAYGRAILVETGLSYNLWAFNEPREDQETIFRILENIANPAERSDYATAKGLARLREDPAILARKIGPGWIYLWRVKPIEDRFIQESYYDDVDLPMFVAALIFDDLLYLAIALAGIAGLALPRSPAAHDPSYGERGRREPRFIARLRSVLRQPKSLLVAWMIYAVPTILLTHGEMRYRHFLFPVLIPYAAWALSQIRRPGDQETRSGNARHRISLSPALLVSVGLCVLIGGVVLFYYPWLWAGQNLARGWHALSAEVAWAAGRRDAALREDERALAAQETPGGWLRLGDHRRALGDTARSLEAYRAAVDMTLGYAPAIARLGDLLRATGDEAAAREVFAGDYIDQQRLVDWSWRELPAASQSYVNVGDGLDFGYVGGVYPAEKQQGALARWSDGRAFLRLLGRGQGATAPGTLRLRLAAPRPERTPVRAQVCAAGRCQSLSIGPTWRTYLLPFDITPSEPILVEIRSDTFEAPEGRRLGVLVDWAEVREATAPR